MVFQIDDHLDLRNAYRLVKEKTPISLSSKAVSRIEECRQFLDDYLEKSEEAIYGINTGFGALESVKIPKDKLSQLQENLVRSHACGAGEIIDSDLVRLMLLIKIFGLSLGHSGVRVETVNLLVELYNRDILPIIYSKGSLGASGDLAPLAHLALPLLGRGEVMHEEKRRESFEVLKEQGLEALSLHSKEGLALLNGTQFMSAHATLICNEAEHLFAWADTLAALALEAFDAYLEPYDPLVHNVRKQEGQKKVSARVLAILEGSDLSERKKKHVQDPYCLRCVPQVHGASWDTLEYVMSVSQGEIESVTDNPTIFPKERKIISAGNFHGQPIAIVLDLIAIAIAEMGSISERRTYKLNSGMRGLPSFLVHEAGLNSGFMITQYTAASMVSENKQLCTPATVDSIDSSQGQEDHVSMGANAATKAIKVLANLKEILAIELFNVMQAIDLRTDIRTSPTLSAIKETYRKEVPFIEQDTTMYPHIQASKEFIQNITPPR